MVDVSPGDSGANKGYWKQQLRDRLGKFAEMGGTAIFDIFLPGVVGKVRGVGIIVDVVDLETAKIEVKDNKKVPKGIYYVKSEDFEMIDVIARLPEDYVEEKLEVPEGAKLLKSDMSGSEVLKERLRSVARALKSEGRFPIPRLAFTQSVGKDSDVAKGAKLDYKKVFDAEPALQQKYGSAENLWEKVFQYAVDDRTQSPNTLAEIPEDMKEINRAYAKHVLGLDPNGLITVYRNAINGKDTPEESAIGYASLDRNMAYDYNANRPNTFANGRYEIDVKPDEIFGMLGYSKIEDEYGFALGRELTNIPGRVRRVGDLASPEMQAPWLEEAANIYRRNQGSSPFRAFNVLGEFDFHPVEPLGESVDEFFKKYNVSAADIKTKFDQLFGEGSYDTYKASGNSVSYQRIRDLFVPLPDGKVGLNADKLEKLNITKVNTAEYKDDLFDNTLKMLSVFQELTGQPFMTHKTRDYAPVKEETSTPPTPEVDFDEALGWYTDNGYWDANKFLREGEPLDGEDQQKLDAILQAIDKTSTSEDMTLYRGRPVKSEERAAALAALKPGDKITDRGIMSTTESLERAEFYTNMQLTDVKERVMFEIDLPKGSKALKIDPGQSTYRDAEHEVLLPPNTELTVVENSVDESGVRRIKVAVAANAEESESASTIYDDFFDGGMVDLRALRESSARVTPYDLEMFSDDQLQALRRYGQAGHRAINKILRSGEPISAEDQKLIDSIDSAIEENGEVFSNSRIFRGDTPSSSSDYYKFLENLTERQIINLPGYFSASNDAQVAFSEFGPGQGGSDDDGSNSHSGSTFFWTIDVPEGGKAMAMPEGVGYGQGAESEVILPRNSKIQILGIKKVEQLDDEGTPNGNYNYFIHASQLTDKS